MTSSNRLTDYFTPHRRFSNKLPRLYLDSRHDPADPYNLQVYFVNNSGRSLEWVKLPNPLLYITSMSETENLASMVEYRTVLSNEAVLVAEFDIIFDSDFVHELLLVWKAKGEPEKEAKVSGRVPASSITKCLSGFLMRPESDFTSTHENFDSEWHVFEFWFDRSAKRAVISNPSTGSRIELPRQDREVDGFHLHEYCDFSPELSSYLRYLQIHHIILFSEIPEVLHVPESDESTASDDNWEDEDTFLYYTLMFRLPTGACTLPYFGFSFVDDRLYSSIYLDVRERD